MTEIGKSMLKASARLAEDSTIHLIDAKRALDSIKWFQKAFMLLDKMEESATPNITELKVGRLSIQHAALLYNKLLRIS